ncbi:MAG: hypothetical protein COW65_05220 [Cytophagales bacterium CG18_big_fil_WC_8_21_14_2_50_42_9]|nr:MAG: hypothetical protein COW65_05220 [Cytophagales bacterium CG18_big_fil_WC_8_21_14_2_50_42_9]
MVISIIIPSKDRQAILSESLEKAYKAISGIAGEIIVVNDSKTQDILLKPEWTDKVEVFNNPKSGVASARNLGASKAQSELLHFMDDDMWLSSDNVKDIIRLHQHFAGKVCLNLNWVYPPALVKQMKSTQFGRYLSYFGFDSLEGWRRGSTWNHTELFVVEGITSQNLSIKKADFFNAGGYNESFPHAGFEDYDFSKRLNAAGIQPYIYPLSLMYHNEADRMEVKSWLARKKRGGETRRVAVEMGNAELAYPYGLLKSSIYRVLIKLEPLLFKLVAAIPNLPIFDSLYFKIVNTLLGTAFFAGYQYSGRNITPTN